MDEMDLDPNRKTDTSVVIVANQTKRIYTWTLRVKFKRRYGEVSDSTLKFK